MISSLPQNSTRDSRGSLSGKRLLQPASNTLNVGGRKPLLADGSVVGSYEPLFRYWELARRLGVEEVSITSEDLDAVREIVERRGRVSLLELRNSLVVRFLKRVNPEVAVEAYRSLGWHLSESEARRKIAEILAGWTLEAARNLNVISLRGWRLPES